MGLKTFAATLTVGLLLSSSAAQAVMRISEWQYNGSEWVEFTNLGVDPIDMSGWSFDDDSRVPGTTDLSAFGVVAPGEAVIMSEDPADAFRAEWKLPAAVKIVGENMANLGRGDEINLFDNLGALVDRLAYGDQVYPLPTGGSIRTHESSGNPTSAAVLELDDVGQIGDWVLSFDGDSFGSYTSVSGFFGNPGNVAPVPEPAAIALCGLGLAAAGMTRRRK